MNGANKVTSKQTVNLTYSARGLDYKDIFFFLRSQAMDEELSIQTHFPQHLSWPALNLFSIPLLHLCEVLTISLNLPLSHFVSFTLSLFPSLRIDRILIALRLKLWDDREVSSMTVCLWNALCAFRNIIVLWWFLSLRYSLTDDQWFQSA